MSDSIEKDPLDDWSYVDTAVAAKLLHVSYDQLKKSRQGKALMGRKPPKCIRVSERKYLYRKSDLASWIEESDYDGNAA